MAKKKESNFVVETSYYDRMKQLILTLGLTGVVGLILFTYAGLMFCAVRSVDSSLTIGQAVMKALETVTKNPFYFLPIDYNIGAVGALDFILVLLLFVMFSVEVRRIHHDVNTLKGSAEWMTPMEFTSQLAESK